MAATHALLDLQTIDLAIDRLQTRRRELEEGRELATAREAADAEERALGELRLQIDALNRDASKFEHEIDSLTQKSAAERARMSDGSVANARELDAIGREVENLSRRQTGREDELLVLMEQREVLEKRAAESEAGVERLREQTGHVGAEAEAELRQVGTDLGIRAGERERLLPGIDPEVLELYEELRAAKRGIGAAALVDGICQGCHEALSAVELDRVKHADGIRRCEHCRRILVL